MDAQTPIIGTGTLTADQIQAAYEKLNAGRSTVPANLGQEIVTTANDYGVNSDFFAAQIADETDYWTSDDATLRNNPAGFGHTDDATEGTHFDSLGAGLDACAAHWLTYHLGDANPHAADDPRFALVPAAHRGTVNVIADIGSGVWASDTDYPQAVLNRWGEIDAAAGGADTTSGGGGAVGTPNDAPIPPLSTRGGGMTPDKAYSLPVRLDLQNNGKSFIDRPTNASGEILAIVKHVTAGESLDGALEWNRNSAVASAHFYIDKDGTVVQDVSLFNGAYACGILDNPTLPPQFDAMQKAGGNPNDFTISIEHVGNPDDADFPTPAQLTADARLTADLCDYFKIPVDEDHIIGHYRFDAVNRPNCPGPHWDFAADVRAVNRLLNGSTDNATASTTAPRSTSGVPTSPPAGGNTGTGGGGIGQVAGGISQSGTESSGETSPRTTLGDTGGNVYADDEQRDGEGRGATVHFPGGAAEGYRIGHGFYDEYTANGGLVGGYKQFGLPRSPEFAAQPPGFDRAVTMQVYERDILVFDGDTVSRLPVGIYAARWLVSMGLSLPSGFAW